MFYQPPKIVKITNLTEPTAIAQSKTAQTSYSYCPAIFFIPLIESERPEQTKYPTEKVLPPHAPEEITTYSLHQLETRL